MMQSLPAPMPSAIEKTPEQTDYRRVVQDVPNYKYMRVLPNSGVSSVTQTTSGGHIVDFDLPSEVINLSRTSISFDYTPAAAGANGRYNWVYVSTLSLLREVHLMTRSGIFVASLKNANKFLNLVRPLTIPLTDVLSNANDDDIVGGYCTLDATGLQDPRGQEPSGGLANTPRACNLAVRTLLPGGNNTATPLLAYIINLKEFVHTLFEQDIDIFFNQIMTLRLIFDSTAATSFYSDNVGQPGSNAAATVVSAAIEKLRCDVAIEQNLNLANNVKAAVLSGSGLSVLCEAVYDYKQSFNNSTSTSTTIRLNRSYGKAIKRIYSSIYHATETGATAYTVGNAFTNTSTLVPYLNGNRLADENIDPFLEWKYLNGKGWLKNCIAGTSVDRFYNRFCHVEKWDSAPRLCDRTSQDDDGYPLVGDTDYTMQYALSASASGNHYQFVVVSRILNINASGVQLL